MRQCGRAGQSARRLTSVPDRGASETGAPARVVDSYSLRGVEGSRIVTIVRNLVGMDDILPEDWPYWSYILDNAFEVAGLYGYRRMETPLVAETSLFTRTSGEGTDVVDKEMYSFVDRDGTEVSLRPEGTAPVMRAYHEHGWHKRPQPVKVCYLERMYRHDRPQRGRYREHRQFGCEAIGSDDAYVDVEMISLLQTFYHRIGLTDLSLHVNSIGDRNCRPAYLAALVDYLEQHASRLAPLDRERIARNPLRVLDSKEEQSRTVIEAAPRILDYLCDDCRTHWVKLLHGLDILAMSYTVDYRLVRGLDYYTRTVFEFQPADLGAQSVVGGGGRYDALSEAMGGLQVPGIGFGTGLERLVLNLRARGIEVPPPRGPHVFLAHVGDRAEDAALALAVQLRAEGTAAEMSYGHRSLKAQMKRANSEEAEYAAILVDDELSEGNVTIRRLSDHEQRQIPAGAARDVLRDVRSDA